MNRRLSAREAELYQEWIGNDRRLRALIDELRVLVLGVMLVAILTVHIKNGFLSTGNGWEMPLLYIAGAFALPFTGFGAYSLDHAFGLTVLTSTTSIAVLYGLAVVQALLNMAIKKTPPAAPAT